MEMWSQRLPLYAYLRPLWAGRRVLEVGSGTAEGAALLAEQGAGQVIGVDMDSALLQQVRARQGQRTNLELRALPSLTGLSGIVERFDLVLVPDGATLVRDPQMLGALRGLVAPRGRLVIAAPSADRQGGFFGRGIGYYDLVDSLTPLFPQVAMFAQTPFLGFGLVQFDGVADAVRIEGSLLVGREEQPSHYVAIAGADPLPSLGYALVQVPFAPLEARLKQLKEPAAVPVSAPTTPPGSGPVAAAAVLQAEVEHLGRQLELARARERGEAAELASVRASVDAAERRVEEAERRARARADEAEARLADLRRKLDEALGQGESAIRVARAQGAEIEELRSRLRRAAEDRGAADAEIAKLRRALAEADESVLSLTRRTAEEMAAVAERMAAGLRTAGEAPSRRDREEVAALESRLRAAEEELRSAAERASAVTERDERIARLETEKQDLSWRVAELEDRLRHTEDDLRPRASGAEDLDAARSARDRAIEDFHRAAAAHVNEVNRLQASLSEQTALVAELEDALEAAERRAAAAEKESLGLRQAAKELEEADRTRRGRLAELEGKLIRLEREKAMAAAAALEAAAIGSATTGRNGHTTSHAQVHTRGLDPRRGAELMAIVTDLEQRVRDEVRTIAAVEQALEESRPTARAAAEGPTTEWVGARAALERLVEAKEAELADKRLELARVRRDGDAREALLLRELNELRAQIQQGAEQGSQGDHSAQLIAMHTTLTNIRRRAARLRDELEGFRRRLDTLPAGVLSSMLEEIGEDLAEFAK